MTFQLPIKLDLPTLVTITDRYIGKSWLGFITVTVGQEVRLTQGEENILPICNLLDLDGFWSRVSGTSVQ